MAKRYDPEGDDAWMSSRQDGDYVLYSDYAALERELEEAREWKESAMTVFSKLDLQAIGKEIGVKLGEDISPKVLPAIKELKRELEEAERERDRLKGADLRSHGDKEKDGHAMVRIPVRVHQGDG